MPADQDWSFNGWANYPTWAVHLWLSNTKEDYHASRGVLADAGDPHRGADDLHEWVKGRSPLEGGSVYGDILAWALQIVDWDEVARALALNDATHEGGEGV